LLYVFTKSQPQNLQLTQSLIVPKFCQLTLEELVQLQLRNRRFNLLCMFVYHGVGSVAPILLQVICQRRNHDQ